MTVSMIYIVADGAWFQGTFNGVVALFNSRAKGSLVAMAVTISAIIGTATYTQIHNTADLVKQAGFYVPVTAVLVGDKWNMQIIDLSESAAIYQVDNVLTGPTAPASLITCIGVRMAQVYDLMFVRSNTLAYSKTGTLFGAQLVAGSGDFRFSEPEVQRIFSDYIYNYTMGGTTLNNKYNIGDLMNSTNSYALIFSKLGPLRGLYDKSHNFLAYKRAITRIDTDLSNVGSRNMPPFLQQVLNRIHGLTNQVSGPINGASATLLIEMLNDGHNYFHDNSMTSTKIIRKSVVMNSLHSGLEDFSTQDSDAAGLVSTTTQTSMAKMRLSQTTSTSVTANTLPTMRNVLLGTTMVLSPVLIVLAVVDPLSWTAVKGYVYTIAHLQTQPILFSILNHAMNFYLQGKLNGAVMAPVTFDQVWDTYSDTGTTTGWLTLSIPFIAWGMMKNLGQVVPRAGNYLGQTLQPTSIQSSSQTVDGNWSCNSMTTGDVQGNKWDTNYGHRGGHMTSRLESGATKILTSSGQSVYNTMETISKLPVNITLDRTVPGNWQQQQRDTLSEAQSLNNSLSQASSLVASQMSQWSQQKGNNDTAATGSNASAGNGLTKVLNTVQSIGSRYARDGNITLAKGIQVVATKNQDISLGTGVSISGELDSERQFTGKITEFTTGVSVGTEAHPKGEYMGRSNSSYGIGSDLTWQGGTSGGSSAQEPEDLRGAVDVVIFSRVTDSNSRTNNASASLVSQLSSTFSSPENRISQYNDVVTYSHKHSQLTSYAESNSASASQNYSQEFVGYVTSKCPGEADQLLSDTAGPGVRAGHDRLAQTFVEDRMKSQLLQGFEQNRGRTGRGTGSVGVSLGNDNLQSEYDTQQTQIENRANAGGMRLQDDVSSDVADKRRHAESQVNSEKDIVISSGNMPKKGYNRLQSEHE